tara:strand:- start:1660 stop:1806 length:147 start_codon:yes stop_codon:yes gene_type:complete
MDSLSNLDLGATILSIAIAGGFVALGILFIRIFLIGAQYLINKFTDNG